MNYKNKYSGLILWSLIILFGLSAGASGQIEEGLSAWQVLSGGGNSSSSADYKAMGTIGQTSTGWTVGSSVKLQSGFWQDVIGGQLCNCTPGDANDDGNFELVDITYMINFVYQDGMPPIPDQMCSGDPNSDCKIDILDITRLINHLYQNGPVPVSCIEWRTACGDIR
jgi:hypothetical protein